MDSYQAATSAWHKESKKLCTGVGLRQNSVPLSVFHFASVTSVLKASGKRQHLFLRKERGPGGCCCLPWWWRWCSLGCWLGNGGRICKAKDYPPASVEQTRDYWSEGKRSGPAGSFLNFPFIIFKGWIWKYLRFLVRLCAQYIV